MNEFSLYSYAWDIEELGTAAFLAEIGELGLTGVTLACAYHPGKFLRPHGVRGKIYYPEDGVVYFRHRPERYGRLQPQAWSKLDEFDPLASIERAAPSLRRTAWVVCCNNSRLGRAYPEMTARNCFGDRNLDNLDPAHPEVRAYVVALCRDLAESHDLHAMVLETPGWLPFVPGFAMRSIDPWLAHGLGLCFSDASLAAAKAAGIDGAALRDRLAAGLSAHLAAGLPLDDHRAAEWLMADFVGDPDWQAYHAMRMAVVRSLVAEIRDAIPKSTRLRVIPSVKRPTAGCWREGSDLVGFGTVADGVEICAYEPDANAVALDAFDVRRRIGDTAFSAVLRTGHPDLGGGSEVRAAAAHLKAAGVDALSFYNYGHMDKPALQRIAQAIEVFA